MKQDLKITNQNKWLILLLMLSGFIVNALVSQYTLAWVLPLIIYYFEKKSYFVKINALVLTLLEVVRGALIALISFVSLQFNLPFYILEKGSSEYTLGPLAYVEMGLLGIILLIKLFIAIKVIKGESIKNPDDKSWLNRLMKRDPQFYKLK